MIETLENRRLLAATLNNGVLEVTGTGGNDTITVRVENNLVVLFFNVGEKNYKLGNVKSVVVEGRAGNDWIANGSTIPVKFMGGDGADLLSGGNGNDTLVGNGGNDRLYGNGGTDVVNPGTGDDIVIGGLGTDTVTYGARKTAVKVFFDGTPSGAQGESDIITGVEVAGKGAVL
jgi:Ca2+-binding RTX toxin-like protein